MKIFFKRTCFLMTLAATIPISGCAYTPPRMEESLEGTNSKKNIAEDINKKLDNICAIPEPHNTAKYWKLRYVRTQLFLSAITRYGAARIEDYYGGEQDVRSAYLLAKVNNSANAIKNAMKHSDSAVSLHKVELADVTNDLLRTAAAAMKATTDKLKNFALAPNFADGRNFLTNALEDALYIQAYKDDCSSLMKAGEDESKIPQIQAAVNEHLVEQCDRVAKMSGLPHNCKN